MTKRPTIEEDDAFRKGLAKAIYAEGASHGLCEDGLRDFITEQIGEEYTPIIGTPPYVHNVNLRTGRVN